MAYVYLNRKDWYGVVYHEGKQIRVSLRLKAPGNKRTAEQRVNALQYEVNEGKLSSSTEWLGVSARRVGDVISSRATAKWPGWRAAGQDYLEGVHSGEAGKVESAGHRRRHVVGLSDWASTTKASPLDITGTMIGYLRSEIERGVSISGVRTATAAYCAVFCDWLTAKYGFATLDRRLVRSSLPAAARKVAAIPCWSQDVRAIRSMQSMRHDSKALWSAWQYFCVTRGLGCRPSEAIALRWDHVGEDRVTLADTKEWKRRGGGGRTCPILYQWALDAIGEMRASARCDHVCHMVGGRQWPMRQHLNSHFVGAVTAAGFPSIRPKMLQKLAIMQMIRTGFPAHAVASWTGHTLTIQERHYMTQDAYLPDASDYEEYAGLSEYGARALSNLRGNISGNNFLGGNETP